MALPGVTVSKSEQILPLDTKEPRATRSPRLEDGEDILDDEEPPEAVKILKEEAKFDEMTVWGHDRLPATDDNFVKGIEEWIAFAEAVGISLTWYCNV